MSVEEAEGHGGLGGGAGFGDDVDGEIVVPDEVEDLLHGVSGEAVAGKVDVGGVFFLQVVVVGAQQLDDRPGAQVAAADADDHQGLAVALDLPGGGLDARVLGLVVVPGQVHPAHEVVAPACGLLEPGVGLLETLGIAFRPGGAAGKINTKHEMISSLTVKMGKDSIEEVYHAPARWASISCIGPAHPAPAGHAGN